MEVQTLYYSEESNVNEKDEFSISEESIEESNPEIDKILAEKIVDYNKLACTLSTTVKHVHSSYLFVSAGKPALVELCKCISSTPTNIYHKSWKDLAEELSLSLRQIGCIENRHHDDYTELVLKTFALKKNNTLSRIVSALETIERYDALSIAEKFFPALASFAEKEYLERTKDIEKVFSQHCDSQEKQFDILFPEGYSQLRYQLPISLQNYYIEDENSVKKEDSIESVKEMISRVVLLHQQACASVHRGRKVQRTRVKPAKSVMLTFAPDGEKLARKVASIFRKGHGSERPPIGVLILEEHAEKVITNPVHFVTHQFAKMDFIIPILTDTYLDEIGKCPPRNTSLISLDTQYIRLIHDLMSKYYVENGCRNSKIRCIYPSDCEDTVLSHPHMLVDPILKVYFSDHNIETLAVRIIKK